VLRSEAPLSIKLAKGKGALSQLRACETHGLYDSSR
jgi:hypothetical protein